jgi:hypothetical protein
MTLHRSHPGVLALLLACGGPGESEPTGGDETDTAATEASQTDGSDDPATSADPPGTSTSGPSTASADGSDTGPDPDTGADTGGEPPLPSGICNENGTCDFPETCSTCPDECGSCDVSTLDGQQAKYVDQACATAGDGLTDRCAGSDGGPGRFNDLQVALDSLEAGDTLYVHPGDYFRPGAPFQISGMGTEDAPIVITAADQENPPVLHSWDPADPTNNALSHAALAGAEEPIAYIVVDHLVIDGLLTIHGDHTRVQYVECTHGWEVCDGNWSCLRIGWCEDCNIHHNRVHDVVDTTGHCSGEYPPREAGLKEFDSARTIWEFNTVEDTAQWGYDLHRSSLDAIFRFNLLRNPGTSGSIRMNRSGNMSAYGNVVIGGGVCVDFVNEDPGDGYENLIEHNTCLFTQSGITFNPHAPTTVTGNVLGGLAEGTADLVNLAAPDPEDGMPHVVDYNAYDTSSQWTTQMYEYPYAETLEEWQASTDYDAHSIAAAGGACTFVDAPSDPSDTDFDLTIAEGPCAELTERAGPAGACAITPCVGHDCLGCGH